MITSWIRGKSPFLVWGITGLFLLSVGIALAMISRQFRVEVTPLNQPILPLVALLGAAGVAYLLIASRLSRSQATNGLLLWIFFVGLLLRIAMSASTPILEVDFNRYMWDGAVTANGLNPYRYSPDQVKQEDDSVPPEYLSLGEASGGVIESINHSFLRTIYPPITQAAFALAHLFKPWSLGAWRLILLLFDLAALGLLFSLLRRLRLSPAWLTIYWWNPLLVKEIHNSGHMDVLVLPFVLAAIYLLICNRNTWAIVFLALAVGVKLWPIALLPLFLRPLISRPKNVALSLGVFALAVAALLSPMYLAGLDANSGIAAYGQRWQLNDALFKLVVWASQFILGIVQVHPGYKYLMARIVVMGLLLFWIGYVVSRKQEGANTLVEHSLWIITAVYFLSPTQFPWYFVWMIPFLAIRPRGSLLLFTALLPLYYLRYYFEARGSVEIFDFGIVWIEFVPVWILLIREWYLSRKNSQPSYGEVASVVEI
ncbi:MAG: glycosyltransferase 87 family protein [Planctomycetota bacterium]|jgi:hypothetical protein